MRTFSTVLVATLMLLAAAGSVVAQEATAPAPSAANATFYAHHNDDGTADDEYVGWMNTLLDDADSDDIAMGDAQQCTTGQVAIPVVDEDLDVLWTLTYAPALTSPISLDPAGTITVTVFIGASGGAGRGDVTTTLKQGETVIFEGASVEHTWTAATAQYASTTWTLTPTASQIEAGQDLVWTIHLTGEPCDAAGGPFLGVHGDRGKSNFVLPIIGGGAASEPTLVFHNETGTDIAGTLEFEETTNETHQYNWTTTLADAVFTYDSILTNGSIKFTVIDGGDANVVEGNLLTSGNSSIDIEDATPGNWSVRVELIAFQGTFEFELGPVEAMPTSSSTAGTTGTQEEDDADQNETDESTPSPGILLVGGALALGLTFAARRRRAL